jgi:amyloid beta precursor protein binding protein 1
MSRVTGFRSKRYLLQLLDSSIDHTDIDCLQGESIENLFQDDRKYTLIMYSFPIEPKTLGIVNQYGRNHKVPLISIHSAGFYSYFRIHLPGTFPIVDTHPDSTATTDLRLVTPWPELSKFATDLTNDIDSLDAHKHGHIPYLVLLLHHLAQWNSTQGSLPSTYKEKTAFRSSVADAARTNNAEGGEENYDEAVAAVLKTISAPGLSSSVKEVFDYQPDEVRSSSLPNLMAC